MIIVVVYGAFQVVVKKEPFKSQVSNSIWADKFGQNCENATAKKLETRTKVDFCLKELTFCLESLLVKLAQEHYVIKNR